MKGIILAGGSGTRLYPITKAVSKQLLPVYDKPMIYYPLSTLMLAGIREILIITTPEDLPAFQRLLGNGSDLGLELSYTVQEKPEGIAQALIIGREFLQEESCCLILGDNLFYGQGLSQKLVQAAEVKEGATVFAYWVHDPARYGIVNFDERGNPLEIVEKPKDPQSNWAVTGLYFFDRKAPDIAASLKPSGRGELEITDVNCTYLQAGELRVEKFGRGSVWLDTGTHASLVEATEYVRAVENRQGLKIACLEEIAFQRGYIDSAQLRRLAEPMEKTGYGQYLQRLAECPEQYR